MKQKSGPTIAPAAHTTKINQPGIFLVEEINDKWYEALPKDLQQIVDSDAAKEDAAIAPVTTKMVNEYWREWKAAGGTRIALSPAEHAEMMKTLASVGTDVSSKEPTLAAAYKLVTAAAERAGTNAYARTFSYNANTDRDGAHPRSTAHGARHVATRQGGGRAGRTQS